MYKRQGNVIDISQILKNHSANALRFFFLQTHYRKALSYTAEKLEISTSAWRKLIHNLSWDEEEHRTDASILQEFTEYMDNDFNTHGVYSLLSKSKKAWLKQPCSIIGNTILTILKTLGFNFDILLSAQDIRALIIERQSCKALKDFSRADAIRQKLASYHVFLSDIGGDTSWYIDK